jgi:hypothetical protein
VFSQAKSHFPKQNTPGNTGLHPTGNFFWRKRLLSITSASLERSCNKAFAQSQANLSQNPAKQKR